MTAPPKRQHRGSFVSLAGTLQYEWRNCTSPICPDSDLPHRDAPPEPAAPDRIGEREAFWTAKDQRFVERLAALEKRVEEQQEQLAAITSSVLRLEDPAPAAQEHGEASLLAKGGTSLDSYSLADLFEAIRHHIRMFPQVCPNIRGDVQDLVEMVEHEVMFAPPDAAPVAEGREKTPLDSPDYSPNFVPKEVTEFAARGFERINRHPPAPRDDGAGEIETFVGPRGGTVSFSLPVPPATAKQPEQWTAKDQAFVERVAELERRMNVVQPSAENANDRVTAIESRMKALAQLHDEFRKIHDERHEGIDAALLGDVIGPGVYVPTGPGPSEPKQPEPTAPEARRWDNRAWVLSGAIVNGADGLTDQEAIAEAIAAYHDAAMERARKDREAVERVEEWIRMEIASPYEMDRVIGRSCQRAIGGPR